MMKLMRLGEPGAEQPAMELDDTLFDLSPHLRDFDGEFFASDGMRYVRELAEATGQLQPLDSAGHRIAPCIATPSKIVGVGLNYADHAREAGLEPPAEPIFFLKAPSSLAGPYDPIRFPAGATKVDWEVELGVVMAKTARHLPDPETAADAVAGYCIANDISERTFQFRGASQWSMGKSADTFCPVGPWLVPSEDVPDRTGWRLQSRVNGDLLQNGEISEMIFTIEHLVWSASQYMTLLPGDLILSGTPAGVALGRPDEPYLREGDLLETSITCLGEQKHSCRAYAEAGT